MPERMHLLYGSSLHAWPQSKGTLGGFFKEISKGLHLSSISTVLQGEGDTVTATVLPGRPGEVVIESIEGDAGRLSLEAEKNCAGIAALETLKLLGGSPSCGVSLRLHKACNALPLFACCPVAHLTSIKCTSKTHKTVHASS